jgi:hypothetical protein
MMIPDKNFRMNKQNKSILALSRLDPEARRHLKHMMIQAQLHEEAAKRAALKSKGDDIMGGKTRGAVAPE